MTSPFFMTATGVQNPRKVDMEIRLRIIGRGTRGSTDIERVLDPRLLAKPDAEPWVGRLHGGELDAAHEPLPPVDGEYRP